MARISAGGLYFALLGVIAALTLFVALRSISPFSGLSAGLALGFVLGEAVVLVALAVLLPLFHVGVESRIRVAAVLEALGRRRAVRVREVKEDRAVRIARRIPLLNRLAERVERGIRGDVVKGGMQLDPYAFAARYSFYSVVLAAVFVPVSLALSVLVSPTLLALMMIPAIIFYTPSLSAKNRVSERKTNVRDELPFFALLASITQSSGRSLVDAFRGTVGKHILPAMEAEARLLQKSIGFGKDVAGALDDLASTHPDDSFKHFLYGYTGVLKSGGDVVLYLSDRTREYLASMRFSWQSYAEKVGT
ncbi:MAG: type II secretion system F family protein, partial [Nitrososphaerota archaeon]|nr:type II secretion system F family protein [Nitrososphaerota archaeon]